MKRALCVLALVAFVGCGPMTNPKLQNDARILAKGYHEYDSAQGKPPPDAKAFLDWAQKSNDKDLQLAIQEAQKGEWVVFYGVKITSMTEGTDKTVLVHHKDVPKSGGIVAMGDGTVKTMTADEFAKAPKAGK